MSFGDWYVRRGRISRRTFWLHYFLPIMAVSIVAMLIDLALGSAVVQGSADGNSASFTIWFGWLTVAVWLATIVPHISSTVARLHDRGLSAWWLLFYLLPIVGALVLLVVVGFLPGNEEPNRYGPPPRPSAAPVAS